jgi:hypothetical protein
MVEGLVPRRNPTTAMNAEHDGKHHTDCAAQNPRAVGGFGHGHAKRQSEKHRLANRDQSASPRDVKADAANSP